jgi:hypothetical protein
MTRPLRFRQADVTRAILAAKAAGLEVSKVEINPAGGIVISNIVGHIPTSTEKSVVPTEPTAELSEVEKWKAKYGASN